jgi:hypothetical protein
VAGIKGQTRLPHSADPRARRNAAGLATDFQGVGGALSVVNGVIVLNLAAIPGLGQSNGLVFLPKAAGGLAVDAGGAYVDPTIFLPVATAATTYQTIALAETASHAAATYQTIALAETASHASSTYAPIANPTFTGVAVSPYFQTSTVPTDNVAGGTVVIVAKDANLLTANAGWLPLKRSDGTTVYVPYWL